MYTPLLLQPHNPHSCRYLPRSPCVGVSNPSLGEHDREFFWSGANSWIDRKNAAESLAAYLSKLMPHWRCHLVSHSHGGNVCHEAIRILAMSNIEPEREVRLVTLGTPFFHRRETRGQWFPVVENPQRIGKGTAFRSRSLAISSNNDEVLKLIRSVLQESDLPQLRNRPSLVRTIKSVWAESRRVAKAQGKFMKTRPFRVIKALLLETSRYPVLRLAWRSIRQEICGLVGSRDDLANIRVRPEPTVKGLPTGGGIYESLPAKLEAEALDERRQYLADSSKPVVDFLETDRWSGDSVDTLFRAVTVGELVHSFYYRNSGCIRRIARWLNAPEPNSDLLEVISDDLYEMQTLGMVPTQDDPWSEA